ncbi:MAG: RluA family pseudouridine synthase [Oligoflexia bacterium]|nr:RluA family pseudouridine synthase [Oligoflexia bacterium]
MPDNLKNRYYNFTVASPCKRLDLLLVEYFGEQSDVFSRTAVQKLIRAGCIKVNGEDVKPSRTLSGGERVEIILPEPEKNEIVPQEIPVRIVYEDDFLIVVNKEAGMVVHPAPGNRDRTLVNALSFYCEGKLSAIGLPLRPGVVHRLDKLTSGLLVVAKDDAVHLDLARQFADKTAKRSYMAVVNGTVKQDAGRIETYYGRHPSDRKKFTSKLAGGKRAVTNYRLVNAKKKLSLLRIVLDTGRTHQIRVHMLEHLFPIVGDPVYNKNQNNSVISRQALHAALLSFTHPVYNIKLSFCAPVDNDIKYLLNMYDLV